jgi:hypothetical protein
MITIQTFRELIGKAIVAKLKNGQEISIGVHEIIDNNTIKCILGKALGERDRLIKENKPYQHILNDPNNYALYNINDIVDIDNLENII